MDNIELYSVFQCILKGINDGHLHSVEEDKIVDVAQSLIDEEDLMELRRKKTLLERVMARLRELITASQQTGDTHTYIYTHIFYKYFYKHVYSKNCEFKLCMPYFS